MSGGTALAGPWLQTVTVRHLPDLERELVDRWRRTTDVRAVGVTDLLALRRAYCRKIGLTAPIPEDRQLRLDQGRAVHRELGDRLAAEGTLEARVRRAGLVGRIDLLADVPVEVKTATSLTPAEDLVQERPDHVDQLAMYCALVGTASGRLLTLAVDSGGIRDVQAVDFRFRGSDPLLAEMRRRADLLHNAVSERTPVRLPRCPWFGRGCEFGAAGLCGCTGEEEPLPPLLEGNLEGSDVRSDVRDRLRGVLERPLEVRSSESVERFRELVFPRRAYFDRTVGEPAHPPPAAPPASETPDFFGRLTEAIESGRPGEVSRLPSAPSAPEEEVMAFRGDPLLVRTSRSRLPFEVDGLLRRSPQYAIELGLRCAVTGHRTGILVIGLERAEDPDDRIRSVEVTFDPLTTFSRFYRERSRSLAAAVKQHSAESLPSCPEWAARECPYRGSCGCPGSPPRVTTR